MIGFPEDSRGRPTVRESPSRPATNKGGTSNTLLEIPVEGGQERLITDHRWANTLFRVFWIENGGV